MHSATPQVSWRGGEYTPAGFDHRLRCHCSTKSAGGSALLQGTSPGTLYLAALKEWSIALVLLSLLPTSYKCVPVGLNPRWIRLGRECLHGGQRWLTGFHAIPRILFPLRNTPAAGPYIDTFTHFFVTAGSSVGLGADRCPRKQFAATGIQTFITSRCGRQVPSGVDCA